MSTIKVNSIEPANAGSEDYFLSRAWVNFNGTGTVAIRDSGNVSSITDSGTASYGVNFTAAMTDTNFSVLGLANGNAANATVFGGIVGTTAGGPMTRTTSSVSFQVRRGDNLGLTNDYAEVNIASVQ